MDSAADPGRRARRGNCVRPSSRRRSPRTRRPSTKSIDFSADQVSYDSDAELVTATGEVRMSRDGNYLAADQVTWNRKTGEVRALGNVVVVNPQGDKLIGENVVLTDTLRDGTIENLLVVLDSGGRIAARARHSGRGEITTLDNAIYSPCPVTTPTGCPRNPSWAITAARVIDDPAQQQGPFPGRAAAAVRRRPAATADLQHRHRHRRRQRLAGARTSAFHPQGARGRHALLLAVRAQPRPHADAACLHRRACRRSRPSTAISTRSAPSRSAASCTYGRSTTPTPTPRSTRRHDFRALFRRQRQVPVRSAVEHDQLVPGRDRQDRHPALRHHPRRSAAQFRQCRADQPELLHQHRRLGVPGPARRRCAKADPDRASGDRRPIPARRTVAGGNVELQANSLAILRIDGQDTQRAFAGARWDLRRLTPLGQELPLTAYARGDLYHTDDSADTTVTIYRGTDGWHARGIAALAADVQWPFVGRAFGGFQRLVPRVQLVLTPPTPNLDIPNEDARAVDLEDSNLFALNRFPGYDRWEDASRITYGVDWSLDRPNLSITSNIGQSYRIVRRPAIFPEGTGPDRPLVRLRRPHAHPLWPADRPHAPLPGRQGQSCVRGATSST